MTLFPGRRDSLSPAGTWARDLEEDLRTIRTWGANVVITLVEEHEFSLLGVPDFARSMRSSGVVWHHLPIVDVGIPAEAFESTWCEVGGDVRAAIETGERVLLHCRAGLGRTGTIAARILVECGVDSESAIRAVRTTRHGTIQTTAQEDYVRRQSATPARLYDRLQGSLLGAAIGDALGSAFEFLDSATIERAIGSPVASEYRAALKGSLLAPRGPGIPTDDTAMTLALMRALIAPSPLTVERMHRDMVTSLQPHGPDGPIFWNGGPGGACVAMLRLAIKGAAPFERLDPNAGGNGAAMRAHPCGIFTDRAVVLQLATVQAKLSHPHPGAVAAAQTVALIVHDALYSGKLPVDLPAEITDPTMVEAWKRAHRDRTRAERLPKHLRDADMAGWNTVATAHAIAQIYADDLETGLGIAAASGKDTDTVATIVGAMLGAVHGRAGLPLPLREGLSYKTTVEELGRALYLTATQQAKTANNEDDLRRVTPGTSRSFA